MSVARSYDDPFSSEPVGERAALVEREWLVAASMHPSPSPGDKDADADEDRLDREWLAAASMLPSPGSGPDEGDCDEEDDRDEEEDDLLAPELAPSGS